jgi:hypothetical protein
MTSGTKVSDKRVTASTVNRDCLDNPQIASGRVGAYSSKTWSGADSPVQQVPQQRAYELVTYAAYDRNGKYLGQRKTRLYNIRSKRTPNKYLQEHDYTANISLRNDGQGDYHFWCDTGGGKVPGYRQAVVYSDFYPNYAVTLVNGLWSSEENSAMFGKLAARLGSGFNLATFLGEGRESLRTITESATRIYKAYKAARKGNFVKAWNHLRGTRTSKLPSYVRTDPGKNRQSFANNWLQLQYGWKPLLNDIYSACKHLAYTQNRDFKRVYRVRHTISKEGNFRLSSDTSFGGIATQKKQWIAKVTSINQGAILGLTDPRATAWELVPFSFVADWFIPIGNYFEEVNLRSALSGNFVLSSILLTQTTSITQRGSGPFDSYMDIYYNATDITSLRQIQGSLPKPQMPELKPLSKVLTFQHAANAVALIVSKMRF